MRPAINVIEHMHRASQEEFEATVRDVATAFLNANTEIAYLVANLLPIIAEDRQLLARFIIEDVYAPEGPDAQAVAMPRPIDVGYPAIVEQHAELNGVGTVEVDGWIHTHPIHGVVYKARTAAAVA
jgi:hypothetical protein